MKPWGRSSSAPGARHVASVIGADAAGVPRYRAAKRSILRAIETGRCVPGSALPSETTLAAELGVSIGTLRKAVDELVAEHIVVRRQGLGTYVAMHDAGRLMFQFFHVERADGLREVPQVDLLSFARGRADEQSAAALRLRAGDPVVTVENALRLQGRRVIHDRIVLPAALFRGLTEKRLRERPGTLYQLYQSDFGITVLRALERARAVAADRASARALGLTAATPVIEVRRTALSFHDQPVEYRISIVDTSRHDYVNVLSRPSLPAAGGPTEPSGLP